MTTPERLRRRQRREEILLILLGIAVGIASFYFHGQDVKQRECLTNVIDAQNSVLAKRGDLAEQEAAVNKAESAATRRLIIEVFASESREESFAAFQRAQRKWAQVDQDRERLVQQRAQNPIPDFPEGTCDA